MRRVMPTGPEGFVAEDIDQVIRIYSKEDLVGRFMLIETKYGCDVVWKLEEAQRRTFGLIDRLLQTADPKRERYRGFYLVQNPDPDPWSCTYFLVNGIRLNKFEYMKFLLLENEIPSYDFGT